jgi:hypothetical protein
MSQQQIQPRSFSALAVEPSSWLFAESIGRDRFRLLLAEWLSRNGWSLAVASRLAELALLAQANLPVPDWTAGMALNPGDLVNHRGHAWEALGKPRSEPAEGDPGWREVGLTSRLHASGLNLFLRGKNRALTSTFLLEVGRLNEWVAAVQAGQAQPPVEIRLRELVQGAVVIQDSDGALGPEELLSIVIGRVEPPPWPGAARSTSPGESVTARQLRAAAAAAGLDIIDDWSTIAAMYPTSDSHRLSRLQQVLRGTGQWDPEQRDDERAACLVLLQRLQRHAEGSAGGAISETISAAIDEA